MEMLVLTMASYLYWQGLFFWQKMLEIERHQVRTAKIATILGEKIGLTWRQRKVLWWGARLHDVGKYRVHSSILLSSDPLSAEDWMEIKKHPSNGYSILFWLPEVVREIAINHHRRVDGGGYPDNDSTPSLLAQIVAVADVYDALSHRRAYKEAWPVEKVAAVMRKDAQEGKLNGEAVEYLLGHMKNKNNQTPA